MAGIPKLNMCLVDSIPQERLSKAEEEKKRLLKEQDSKEVLQDSGRPDFRNILDYNERQLKRIEYILSLTDLTPIIKSAAIILLLQFKENDGNRKHIVMTDIFPVQEYTTRTRTKMLDDLVKLDLIGKKVLPRKGQEIELKF